MNFKLNEQNGNVNYLMMAGNDIVLHHTTIETATWACENNEVKNETLCKEHPDYCIHAGQFYFEGKWEKQKPKKRIKDAVCNNDYCELE